MYERRSNNDDNDTNELQLRGHSSAPRLAPLTRDTRVEPVYDHANSLVTGPDRKYKKTKKQSSHRLLHSGWPSKSFSFDTNNVVVTRYNYEFFDCYFCYAIRSRYIP